MVRVTDKDWRDIKQQMSRPMIDCARCGLAFRQRLDDKFLCTGCEGVWIQAGRPEDELPPMSGDHWIKIVVDELKPKNRSFPRPKHPAPVEEEI